MAHQATSGDATEAEGAVAAPRAQSGHDIPRVRLEPKPDPEDLDRRIGLTFPVLPFVILVLGDLTRRPDPRELDDRQPIRIERDSFDKVMAEHKLVARVAPAGAPAFDLRFRRLADFAPASLAQQVAFVTATRAEDALALVPAVLADPTVSALERVWRSLRMLVEQAGEHAWVEILNGSAEDLDADLDDAPELAKSGLWRWVHRYNHPGMRPYSVLVLADDLGPRGRRLRDVSEIARHGNLVVLMDAPEHDGAEPFAGHEAWRASDAARFVGCCAPRFVAAPALAERPRIEGRGAFVVAALMLRSHARYLTGCHFADDDCALPGVALAEPPAPAPGAGGDRSGLVSLATGADGVRVGRDESCHSGDACFRSLSLRVLGDRIVHEALNAHWQRSLDHDVGADAVVTGLNRGLATRLAGTGFGARVAVVPSDRPTPPFELQLEVWFESHGASRSVVQRFTPPHDG